MNPIKPLNWNEIARKKYSSFLDQQRQLKQLRSDPRIQHFILFVYRSCNYCLSCLINMIYDVFIVDRHERKIGLLAHQPQPNLFSLLQLRSIIHLLIKPYLIREGGLIKHTIASLFLLELRLLLRIQEHINKRILHGLFVLRYHGQFLFVHRCQQVVDRPNIVTHLPLLHIRQ